MIKAENVSFEYIRRDDEGNVESITRALDEVSLEVKRGDFVAILGHNGSGKSTMAKHINAILVPTEGTVWVNGMDTAEEDKTLEIRQSAGMVFQNPDNQIIATVVEEDVGFGPENLGVPTEEIWRRVEECLKKVGMLEYRKQSPNKLSGGQKQRVAIAGIMAMKPQCIVLDEPTAMLDPSGRKEVLDTVHELNRREGITVLLITHYMDEVIDADRVIVMDGGKAVMQGTPREIFSRVEELKKYRLEVPQVTELAYELKKSGINLPDGILTDKEFCDELTARYHAEGVKPQINSAAFASHKSDANNQLNAEITQAEAGLKQTPILILDKINYRYGDKTVFEHHALCDIDLVIPKGQFIGIIGHTGSGKSTLIQHMNGLLRATTGNIYFNGKDIYDDDFKMKELRSHVGLVFQYPEHQLFETTVIKDVQFGPKNLNIPELEVELRSFEALKAVGIGDELLDASPFELSGGQKRRVAIAGVLAMKPDVLILDEPTAGLDPKGRSEILDRIAQIHREQNMTVILVSHSMEDVAEYVERIIVMEHGGVFLDGKPKEVFAHYKELESIGLAAPQVTYLCHELNERGIPAARDAITIAEARDSILSLIN